MTLSPTNPGYDSSVYGNKGPGWPCCPALKMNEYFAAFFFHSLISALTILGLFVRTLFVTDLSFRFKSLCNYLHIISVMVLYWKGQNLNLTLK